MRKLLLIVKAALRSQLRWAGHHLYAWLVLGPLVLGLTYATAARFASNLPAWHLSDWSALALALLFEASFVWLNLSQANAELYHLNRQEASIESLPVHPDTHFHAALIARLARTAVAGVVILVAISLFSGGEMFDRARLAPLSLFVPLTTLAEFYGALNWIHWEHTKGKAAAAVAIAILIATVTLAALLLALTIRPGIFASGFQMGLLISGLAWAASLYFITRASHGRWRSADIEYAKRLQSLSRRSLFQTRLFARRFNAAVSAQIARDLQLTLRGFSTAVYVSSGIALLWLAALIAALATDYFPPASIQSPLSDEATWFAVMQLPQVAAVKLACVFATTSLAALLPVIVAYELPHLWLERAAGTTGLDIWQAKLWYTRSISMPVPLSVWLIGLLSGQVPLFYVPFLLLECLMLWWSVSSLIGGLSFEMPNRPGLSITLMVVMGLGAGVGATLALMTSLFLILGLMIYGQVMHALTGRGRERARYYLITEGD